MKSLEVRDSKDGREGTGRGSPKAVSNAFSTSNEVRICDQFKNREPDRCNDSPERAGESGQGDQVKRGASEERRVERGGDKDMKRKVIVLSLSSSFLLV